MSRPEKRVEEIAEKLYNQTMRDIEYGDSRDNPKWKETVKRGFIAYAINALTNYHQDLMSEERERLIEIIDEEFDLEIKNGGEQARFNSFLLFRRRLLQALTEAQTIIKNLT